MKRNKFLAITAVLAAAVLALSACSNFNEDAASAPLDRGSFGLDADYDGLERNQFLLEPEEELLNMGVARVGAVDGPASAPPPVASAPLAGDSDGARVRDADWEELAEGGENEGRRHIIQNADVEMETEYFDDVVADLRDLADTAGGYVESEMLTTRGRGVFSIVMRVPAAEFANVLAQAENLADVRTSRQNAQDVTDQFYDTISNLETRRIEEDRLLALIEEAENIHDLLALETRLTNTRMSIETYLAQLNNLAGQIAFSTITVTLFDITQAPPVAPPTFAGRISGAFDDSLDGTVGAAQNLVVFFAGVIIPFTIFGLCVFAIFLFVRMLVKRSRRRRASAK